MNSIRPVGSDRKLAQESLRLRRGAHRQQEVSESPMHSIINSNASESGSSCTVQTAELQSKPDVESGKKIAPHVVEERLRVFHGMTKKSALRLKIEQKVKLFRDNRLNNFDLLDICQSHILDESPWPSELDHADPENDAMRGRLQALLDHAANESNGDCVS